MQRVIEQLWPEYIRPVREGRIEASRHQQLYAAFRDKAVAAKELFESGLQNHASLSAALSARYALCDGPRALKQYSICLASPSRS